MNPYLDLLHQALEADIGILVATDNVPALQQKLYTARRRAADPKLNCLILTPCPTDPDKKLRIIKHVKKPA